MDSEQEVCFHCSTQLMSPTRRLELKKKRPVGLGGSTENFGRRKNGRRHIFYARFYSNFPSRRLRGKSSNKSSQASIGTRRQRSPVFPEQEFVPLQHNFGLRLSSRLVLGGGRKQRKKGSLSIGYTPKIDKTMTVKRVGRAMTRRTWRSFEARGHLRICGVPFTTRK
jgi:hypothetical protein